MVQRRRPEGRPGRRRWRARWLAVHGADVAWVVGLSIAGALLVASTARMDSPLSVFDEGHHIDYVDSISRGLPGRLAGARLPRVGQRAATTHLRRPRRGTGLGRARGVAVPVPASADLLRGDGGAGAGCTGPG